MLPRAVLYRFHIKRETSFALAPTLWQVGESGRKCKARERAREKEAKELEVPKGEGSQCENVISLLPAVINCRSKGSERCINQILSPRKESVKINKSYGNEEGVCRRPVLYFRHNAIDLWNLVCVLVCFSATKT